MRTAARILMSFAAASLATGALIAAPSTAGAVPLRPMGCPTGCEGAQFTGNGVNIRSCASDSCASLGLGYESQRAETICSSTPFNKNGYLHIEDMTTGVVGWSSDKYVLGNCD